MSAKLSPLRRRVGPNLIAGALLGSVMLLAVPALAAPRQQADDDEPPASVSHPVVEPTAPSAGKALNAALVRLARDPRNVDALLAAGDAAIALGDNEAALGFFSRADQLAPTGDPGASGRVKAAIAGARLHLDDPVEALRWYADAEKAGADPVGFALDRGLAYDLVGDNAAAVAQYRKVLDHGTDATMRDEATRREAVSLAIGGDRRGADLALLPLLQRQDRAAWRAHTFVLAVAGRSDDAVSVARATMPPDLAEAISPYLRFMVRLTPAQQAAVASLGRFPRAADIGRDDPRVMAYTAAHPRVLLAPAAAPALAQAGTPSADDAKSARARRRNGRSTASVTVAAAAPAQAEPDIALPPPPPPPPVAAALSTSGAAPGAPQSSRTTTQPRAGFDLAQVSGSSAGSAAAPPIAAVVPRPTVLSRLDMPPPPRRTAPVTALPVASPPAVAPTNSGIVAIPLPASSAVPVTAPQASHAVVEPIPSALDKPPVVRTPHQKPTPDKSAQVPAEPAKAAKPDKAGDDADKPKSAKDRNGHARAGKDKPAEPVDDARIDKDKSGHAKSAHGKAAKDEADDTPLAPCKPAAGKTRKGKAAAAKNERGHAAKSRSRHGAKGKKDAAEARDSDTCAAAARGDRPDGPGDVSRDSDSDDSRNAKSRSKGKGHDKTADRDSDKAGEKGGRHARYASRIWVEVLTGGDRDKMPGEWRNLVHKAHKLKGRKAYITPWHSNFRLLTGPFDSDADAQDFIAELRKDGVSGFEWTSPAGQAVDSLAVP